MSYSLPQNWDESTFMDDVSNHPELYDINEERYSNNEHRHSIFQHPATPTIHGEGSGFANWGQVPYQMEGAGDLTRDIPFEEM